jgi:transposase
MAQIWAGRRLVPPHLRGKRARARLLRAQGAALADNNLKAWRRPTAVLLCLDGRSVVQIADQLGVHNSAVSKLLGGYLSRGFDALIPGTSPGNRPRLDAQQLQQLGELVEQGPRAAASPRSHAHRIELHRLPPYSPEFDAIEGVWKTTRRTTTHNRYFGSPAERDAALRTTFEQFKRQPSLIEGHVLRFRASLSR